jgi:DNA-binding LacI/PurR family transcriptional regulator
MPPTIYDVAKRAGVSVSTVSLALNAPGRVREGTLSRILQAADELSFVPNAEAVTRARTGVRRIGVFAPFSSYPSYAHRLNGVLRAAASERFEVVVYDQESPTRSHLASLPLTGRVDGLIVMSPPFDAEIASRLDKQRITTVLVGLEWPGFSSVMTDDAVGARMVAELLTSRGHEVVAYLGSAEPGDQRWPSTVRFNAFRDALAGAPQVRLADPTRAFGSARELARELLTGPRRPTAIFAGDDLLASGALRAAADVGLAVPDECAVVGFDDSDLAEPLGLTTVRQPLEESGRLATESLIAQLHEPSRSARQTTLSVSLVERATT